MKRKKTILKSFTLALIMLFSTSIYAQFGQLGSILSTGQDDAEKIFDSYLSPYANGMGAALSTGWYNSAKPHKLGGFDVTVSFNLAFIPSADQSYDANDLNLGDPTNGLTVAIDGASSPTAAGKKNAGQTITYNQNVLGTDVPITSFNLPKGTGFAYTPMPMLQVGIGLVKGTELDFRYSPNLEWGNGSKIGLWGIGAKHSIKQWIPALKKLPILDLTLQGGYTKLKSTTGLNFQPSVYQDMGVIKPGDIFIESPGYYDNQELLLDISNLTVNILASADFKIINIYGGVGISNTKSQLQLTGNYPKPELVNPSTSTQLQLTEETALTDPIDLSVESSDGSALKPRFNAGLRFKFAVVTINFDYTYANYSIASAGLGISFR